MKRPMFSMLIYRLKEIAKAPNRDALLNEIMSCGFLFLDLTDKQVEQLKNVLKFYYTDLYIVHAEPDEHGFTDEFMYLRFK